MSHKATLPEKLFDIQGKDPIEPSDVPGTMWRKFGIPIHVMGFPPLRMLRDYLCNQFLRDPVRDRYLFDLVLKWSFVHFPAWFYLCFLFPWQNNQIVFALCTMVYLLTWFDELEVYILSLHCVVHRPSMKNPHHQQTFKTIYTWVFGWCMGVTPETYQAHHVGMHHVRNNSLRDVSSTMPYKRDTLWGILQYFLKFHFAHGQVCQALQDLGNTKAMKKFILGETTWAVLGLFFAAFRGLPPLLLLWFAPVIIVRTGMLLGNWGQHSFLNDADPHNDFNLSCVIVDSEYNTKSFNDGYHIMHHMYPSAHFLDLPKLFVKDAEKLAEHDSIVFTARQGDSALLDWPSVTFLLLQDKYDVLAEHFVDMKHMVQGLPKRSKEEIITLLKSRTGKAYTQDAPTFGKAGNKSNLERES